MTKCALAWLLGIVTSTACADWLVAPIVSVGRSEIEDSSHGGTIGTGADFGGFPDGQLTHTHDRDTVAGIGVTLARNTGSWGLEAELLWRFRQDWDLTAPTPSIDTITNVFTNVATTTLIVNVLRRFAFADGWSTQVGAGIGIAHVDLDSNYIEREVIGVSPERVLGGRARYLEFTPNAFIGVERRINERLTLGIRYRYIDLGDLETGRFAGHPAQLSAANSSQELILTAKYRFETPGR